MDGCSAVRRNLCEANLIFPFHIKEFSGEYKLEMSEPQVQTEPALPPSNPPAEAPPAGEEKVVVQEEAPENGKEAPESPAEPKILLDVDEKEIPLCPKTNIQASNFFLGDNTKYAVHCVLCSNSREEVRRMPQLNLSLSLVLNEKLAEQLFDEQKFRDGNWEGKVDEILDDFKTHFEKQCTSLREMMIERLQNESHEFMLKKIKSFLDQARSDYKAEPRDFSKLQELCSTFNDFLLLKKSDEVATAEQEVEAFKKYFGSMKKTMELNFKYLNTKIEGRGTEEAMSKSRTAEAPVMSFAKPMETSVVVNSTMPVNYGYQAPTQVRASVPTRTRGGTPTQMRPTTPNRVISSPNTGFFDNIVPNNGVSSYTNVPRPAYQNNVHTEVMTSSRPVSKSQQHVEVRGVSPGLRTIKKVRVSQRAGTPTNVKVIRKSANTSEVYARPTQTVQRNNSRNVSPSYTETVTHVNGMRVIRRSISASNRGSHVRQPQRVRQPMAPAPSFNAVDEVLQSSTILVSPAAKSFIKSQLFSSPVGFVLLYRSSQHGLSAAAFHSHVDNKGPTLNVFRARETGAVFGGFNDKTWLSTENGECLGSDESFLFSVDKRIKHELIGTNNHNAIGCYGKHGPVFGKFSSLVNNKFYYNYDLFISLSSGGGDPTPSSSALGKTYRLPEGVAPDSNEARAFLANCVSFTVDEVEVYGVVPKRGYN